MGKYDITRRGRSPNGKPRATVTVEAAIYRVVALWQALKRTVMFCDNWTSKPTVVPPSAAQQYDTRSIRTSCMTCVNEVSGRKQIAHHKKQISRHKNVGEGSVDPAKIQWLK